MAFLELSDQELVPSLPGFKIALEEGLSLVVPDIFHVEVRRLIEPLLEVAERRLEFGKVFAAGHGVGEGGDRTPGHRVAHAAHARVVDVAGLERHRPEIADRLINRVVGNLDPALIDSARDELAAAELEITARRDENADAATAVEGIDADLRAKRQALTGWHDRKAREEVRETQLRLRQENLHEQTAQRYGIDLKLFAPEPRAFLESYQTLAEQPGTAVDWARVEVLVAGLREKLDAIGAVNVDAIAEYDALEERYQFLESQNADLVAAKTDLLEIIAKINATTRTLFAETFERVRVNFQEMYTELFGGGRANLLLANEEDPLECGIDIIARPPGKQLQSITLLSGGEKTMTAVALLFAIYMVKPSPFCVLDEMDAPLDESNIARFLKILDRFVAQSQFIVITHNKRTIARADVLYGVTMEEAGVSKLVAVRLAAASRKPPWAGTSSARLIRKPSPARSMNPPPGPRTLPSRRASRRASAKRARCTAS